MNKNKSFDSQVRKKLSEISTPPSYGAWETFHQKLNADKINGSDDENFDATVKTKLKEIDRNHVSVHWEKLKYRLETIEIFQQKIIINKLKESLAVLLFLFTFYNISTHILPESKEQEDIYVDAMKNLQGYKYTDINDGLNELPSNHQQIRKEETAAIDIIESKVPTHSSAIEALQKIQYNGGASDEFIFSEPSEIEKSLIFNNSIDHEAIVNSDTRDALEYPLLPSLDLEGISIATKIIPLRLPSHKVSKSESRVGLYVSHVNNFILTPYDKVYALPKFSNSTTSQEYGVTFSKKIKNIELESGIGYSKLRYGPSNISETFGATGSEYLETSLTGIEFDFVKIPLNVKYFIADKTNWKIYTIVGASFQILAQAEYNIEDNIKKGQPVIQNRFVSDGPKLDEKPFTTGLLDEGKLSENYFVDLHLGFGVERKISDRIQFYVQPSYHAFALSDGFGIGPNNDKLNALHLQTGVKLSLN